MKVAITGASGFIGRYLTADRIARGDQVVALGRDAATMAELEALGAEVATTNYSRDGLEEALSGVDAVVHLAGRRSQREDDPQTLEPFLGPNVSALEALWFASKAAGVKDFVFASTVAVYSAGNRAPFVETDTPLPLNPYGLSKRMGEEALELWSRTGGPRMTALRFAAVYGHGERISAVLMKFADAAMRKQPLTLKGNPNINIDQLYVRDAVGAVDAALSGDHEGGVFNIGAGRSFSLAEMAEAANAGFHNTEAIRREDIAEAPVERRFMAIDAAAQALAWKPTFTLDTALADFHDTWLNKGLGA